MSNKKKPISKASARFQLEVMDYSPSIKKLHLAAFDLRFMADDLVKTIQQEFPENESWDELLKSFDKAITDCMGMSASLFPEYLTSLCDSIKEPILEGEREGVK